MLPARSLSPRPRPLTPLTPSSSSSLAASFLQVLVVAEHIMGVWGLMLAVPLTVFALDYCIRYPQDTITDVGKKELEVVLASM